MVGTITFVIGVITTVIIIVLIFNQIDLTCFHSDDKIDSDIKKIFQEKGYITIGIANPSKREINELSPFKNVLHIGPTGPFFAGEKKIIRKIFVKKKQSEETQIAWVKVIQSIYSKSKYKIIFKTD